jgi:DNA (cytosine-5)-methyltransferase 1
MSSDIQPPNAPAIVDLFAGVGGLSLGACRAGFSLRLAVERDRHASAAHKKNFPNARHSDADIASLSGSDILKLAGLQPGELEGLIGGPPCQGFSFMGHKNVEDSRNRLFHKFFDLVREAKPRFFLAENVPGIRHARYAHLRDAALALVRDEYTVLDPFDVIASDYGAATIRPRVIFFGYRKSEWPQGFTRSDFNPPERTEKVTVGDALRGLPVTIKETWLTDEVGWRVVRNWPQGEFGKRIKDCRPDGIGDSESIRMLAEEQRVSGCVATIHTPKVVKRFLAMRAGEVDKISRATKLDPKG